MLAGAGTGKTRALTTRLAHILAVLALLAVQTLLHVAQLLLEARLLLGEGPITRGHLVGVPFARVRNLLVPPGELSRVLLARLGELPVAAVELVLVAAAGLVHLATVALLLRGQHVAVPLVEAGDLVGLLAELGLVGAADLRALGRPALLILDMLLAQVSQLLILGLDGRVVARVLSV